MLMINKCEKLESLPEGIGCNNICRLECVTVVSCPSLRSIPRVYFPSTLDTLIIWSCPQLEPIAGNLLQDLSLLGMLGLCNCPDVICSLEVFSNPNLKLLSVGGNNMRWPQSRWGLHTLTSLYRRPSPRSCFFSWLSPSSSHISHHSPFGISPQLEISSLISLKTLEFRTCPSLQSFVPRTLARLVIFLCPILKKRCSKDKGKDWPKIAHIPYVEIDSLYNNNSFNHVFSILPSKVLLTNYYFLYDI